MMTYISCKEERAREREGGGEVEEIPSAYQSVYSRSVCTFTLGERQRGEKAKQSKAVRWGVDNA